MIMISNHSNNPIRIWRNCGCISFTKTWWRYFGTQIKWCSQQYRFSTSPERDAKALSGITGSGEEDDPQEQTTPEIRKEKEHHSDSHRHACLFPVIPRYYASHSTTKQMLLRYCIEKFFNNRLPAKGEYQYEKTIKDEEK